jgi:hypothetical protein
MRILQKFLFRVPKKTGDGVIFDGILKVLETTGYRTDQIQFCLQNNSEGLRKISPVARVMKFFPELERFQGSYEQVWDKKRVVFLSNSDARLLERVAEPSSIKTGSHDSIDTAILSEILHGVPKRFPFRDVDIFFAC